VCFERRKGREVLRKEEGRLAARGGGGGGGGDGKKTLDDLSNSLSLSPAPPPRATHINVTTLLRYERRSGASLQSAGC